VLAWQPRHVQALTYLAVIAFQDNEFETALELARKALEVDPRSAATQLLQGHALSRLGRNESALASYDRAIALLPGLADAHLHRADVLCQLGRHREALSSYDEALRLKPGSPEIYNNRGNVLKDLERLDEALASYDRAIALNSDDAQARCNRGNLLSEMGRLEEALASYDSAIALDPAHADAHCNRGNLLADLGRYGQALESLDRAVAIDPQRAHAHFSRSLVHLVLGNLPSGWRDFEWRWKNEYCITSREMRQFSQPLWRGEASLEGKTLLLHCEQGLGDTIQFCRYATLAAERGARVVFEVPRSLHGLLASLAGVAQWVVQGEPLPPFDCYCPLLSMPLAFNTTLETIPAKTPYLRAGNERLEHWRHKLGERTRPRVGLVWSGGFRPNQPELRSVNERRNIPLRSLAALRHCDIEFYSLQKGQPAQGELAALLQEGWDGPSLNDHTHELRDFEDTAALIEQLDLVISVDTSSAHLAGALGKPVWILNRFDTCWRWLTDRTDSPWYPTLRLYRQERRGDWDGVVQKMRQDLEAFAATRAR
jgi:tetratricopeptide (TPR) repeat protein